ncbi:drug/metabolite transporter (DMT)-like permease [Paraburkholderia sp. HC6.4b]|uniref:DMT family transporter n=1 Tax=unclassified Paraburkholderia TaxID=2615204 RepID=UPI001620CFC9|nr:MULTISPECIES: DMT family transporter [unclassified Paraburkholderia]MBB5410570.1 drug/metabolite transporter (DMT)-like permease [Paraburkholderia sp. HC6.4b]MBB5452628.1 drug/metabolite transporter (DMT)-like permease [Paraburkholderia sp. Kb1A]
MNRYALLLITSMLLVGSNVGIGKSIVAFVPVPLFALLRFVIAMAVLWPLLRATKLRRVKRDEWINLFLQALFGTFGFTLLMLNGVARTSAVAAGVITSTIPAVVALLSWLIMKERPDGRALASIALAIVGVVVINVAHVQAGADATAGTGSLAHFDYRAVPSSVWMLVLWYGLSASIFSFWLWMKGIRHVPGSLAGVFSAVLPVAAALYGIEFLGERPTLAHGIALACVVAGIGLASLKARSVPPIAS